MLIQQKTVSDNVKALDEYLMTQMVEKSVNKTSHSCNNRENISNIELEVENWTNQMLERHWTKLTHSTFSTV